jgi:hypothetical protein
MSWSSPVGFASSSTGQASTLPAPFTAALPAALTRSMSELSRLNFLFFSIFYF